MGANSGRNNYFLQWAYTTTDSYYHRRCFKCSCHVYLLWINALVKHNKSGKTSQAILDTQACYRQCFYFLRSL